MRYKKLHRWDISPKEAIVIQNTLREKIIVSLQHSALKDVRYIAGADVAYQNVGQGFSHAPTGYAAVVVMTFPDLEVVEEKCIKGDIKFPYIPGLLSFREAPIILKAFEKLKREPDLIIFDGQGIAHPRGMGIASHLGIILDKPTIGCAKSKLFGSYDEPGKKAGDFSHLFDNNDNIIGAVVRTKSDTKPVFVSIGHKIDLQTSIKVIQQCTRSYKIPEPIRLAHNLLNRLRNKSSVVSYQHSEIADS
jgi:deoxyribonuclease V